MRARVLVLLVLFACGDNREVTPPDGPTGCQAAADCNDHDACTDDTCSAGTCEHAPKLVDDQIECTADACDPQTGTVMHTPIDSVCNDNATCSTDACDPTAGGANPITGCLHTFDDAACNDGFSCTTNTCAPGGLASDPTTGCIAAPDNSTCGDTIDCTTDVCNPSGTGADAMGCTHAASDAACGDGVTCTQDRCQPAAGGADAAGCTHAAQDSLCPDSDGRSCTHATCSPATGDPTTGCLGAEVPDDTACDDHATCSTDTCSASGPTPSGCVHVLADAACIDGAECSTDACSPGAAGADATTGCLYTADATACSSNATCNGSFDCVCDAGFTGTGLVCTGVTCDALTAPANGSVLTTNGGLFPSSATYSCNTGYSVIGTATRTCGTNGMWSGAAPTCARTFFVVRVGDGSAALSSASAAVFLDERDQTGALLRTLTLPTAAAGSNLPFTLGGAAMTEGGLSLSADSHYLVLAGYAAAPGTAAIANTTNLSTDASPTNRVIARVDSAGAIDTSTHLFNAFSGNSVRGATSTNGTDFWASGNGTAGTGGVHYVTLGNTAASSTIESSNTNIRQTHVFGGQLYISSGSGTHGVLAVGAGTPTTTGQTNTLIGGSSTSNPDSFVLLDLDSNVAGLDTLYMTWDAIGGVAGRIQIEKWTFDGAMWNQVTTFAPTASGTIYTTGLLGWAEGSTAKLIVVTNETLPRVLLITDDGSTPTPTPTVLTTAGTNTVLRGVALSPLP